MSDYKFLNAEFMISAEDEARLAESLPFWQGYQSADGSFPFAQWTVEDLFRTMMEEGSIPLIKKKIHFYRWKAGLEAEPFEREEVASRA